MKNRIYWKGVIKAIIPFIFGTVLLSSFFLSCQKEEIIEPENATLKSATIVGSLTYFTTPEEFPCTGIPMEDFEEANAGVFPLMPNPLDENTNNHIFSTGEILPGILLRSSTNNSDFNDLLVANSSIFSGLTSFGIITQHSVEDYLIIEFSGDNVTNVGMKVININDVGVNIEIFGTSGSLGTTTVAGTCAGIYWGVQSTEPIKKITLNGIYGQGEGVDDVMFGTCVVDSDGDGCNDPDDALVNSNMEEFIDIDGCNTGVPNKMTLGVPCGTMMSDVMDALEVAKYKNHGAFVKAVLKVVTEWVGKGWITPEEKEAILVCADASSIGNKK